MKKIFLLFLLVCSTNLYAQHIVFKGVALGQHYSVLGRTLLMMDLSLLLMAQILLTIARLGKTIGKVTIGSLRMSQYL